MAYLPEETGVGEVKLTSHPLDAHFSFQILDSVRPHPSLLLIFLQLLTFSLLCLLEYIIH